MWNTQNKIRVRTNLVPDIPLRRPGHTGEITAFAEHVQDDLEVEMGDAGVWMRELVTPSVS